MKKSRSFLAVLIVSLSYVLSPVTAKADLWDVPVAPGETFRWVFVTSEFTDALSSDIGDYNDFVNDLVAIPATPITGVLGKDSIDDIVWKAIASTPTRDAFDNIGGESTASIFTPDSIIVAYGTSDLFSQSHENPMTTTELGTTISSDVWTGSTLLGTSKGLMALGGTGWAGGTGTNWLLLGGAWIDWVHPTQLDVQLPLYAISEELTVVPVPSALILGATGLLSSTLGLKRLRRKR